jgi:hypothetical protein
MEMKMTMKSTLTSAVVTLGIAVTTVPAHAETDFSTLGGIPAEPMKAAEMDAVQDIAYLRDQVVGQYLLWYDDRFSGPFQFDLHLPSVQLILAYWRDGALGTDPDRLFLYLLLASPVSLELRQWAWNQVMPPQGGYFTLGPDGRIWFGF